MKKKPKKIKKNKKPKKPKKASKSKSLKKAKKFNKKRKKFSKKNSKKIKKRTFSNNKKKNLYTKIPKAQKESLILKLVKLQLSLKPEFNFKISFSLEKYIQRFFDKISETISSYKTLKYDEKRRLKLEKIENERNAKIALEKKKIEEETLRIKLKEQALKDEARLEKQRTKDIKLFLRKEQALLRIEQAEKQNSF